MKHFEFRMIRMSRHFKTPSNRSRTLKNFILDILIIQIGQLVQKISTNSFFLNGIFVMVVWNCMDIPKYTLIG